MRVQSAFAYVVITLYDRLFQAVRLAAGLVTLWFYTDARPTTPSPPLKSQISLKFHDSKSHVSGRLGLGSSAFARRY